MSEKFSLKWNDFHSNVSKSFGLLREEDYLADVTLVCDDNKQMSAHKLVLSACSNYFKEVFRNNPKMLHPLLCLNGVLGEDLSNILDYIYNGQVSVHQDHLDRFLAIAQRLKLQGLLDDNPSNEVTAESLGENCTQVNSSVTEMLDGVRTDEQIPERRAKENSKVNKSVLTSSNILNLEEKINECLEKSGAGLEIVEIKDDDEEEVNDDEDDDDDGDEDDDSVELEEQINEYLDVSERGIFKCTICGDTSKLFSTLKKHIKTHFNLELYHKIASQDLKAPLKSFMKSSLTALSSNEIIPI